MFNVRVKVLALNLSRSIVVGSQDTNLHNFAFFLNCRVISMRVNYSSLQAFMQWH